MKKKERWVRREEREGERTYPGNGIFYLLRFARLDQFSGFIPYGLELLLVVGDAFFQLRDVVLRVFVSAVEQVAHADEGVALALEVFQDAFFPALCLVLEQTSRLFQVPCGGVQTFVEHGDLVGVDGVGVFGGFGDLLEGGRKAEVFGGHAFVALGKALHHVA